ncbi:AraC family transcriptional regulator [Aquimarina algicola]|uniref:AraC family transcriptional regulator n=1 Tax=Aquimarina algicola TaxID=2589995 RepID=A0A504J968_9FLAO|nr:AraC family transcriptional regulator [Aquimarina algicola]TPN84418.1 AraC family transcriptional regulator [Aquimarina algicola]
MRLTYKENDPIPDKSFLVRRDTIPCIEEDWHFHKELELIYFLKSSGTRYVGNSIHHFNPGDLYLIGSNLPHLFKNNSEYYLKNSITESVDVIVVKFEPDFLGEGFMKLSEMKKIKSLLYQSNRGIKFSVPKKSLIHNLFIDLVKDNGALRIIKILEILHTLSQNENFQFLCGETQAAFFRREEKQKIAKIITYLTSNYDKKIELKEIASIAHMTPNSFCRYFKKQTHKSFSQYLNEIRIVNACKLLIEGKLQITTICYQCGFNTITNFNRQFKNLMGITPSEYQKKSQAF